MTRNFGILLLMNKIKLGIIGPHGRMGKAMVEEAESDPGIEIVSALVKKNAAVVAKKNWETACPETFLSKIDVIADFSSPSSLKSYLGSAVSQKKPLVLGTTGLQKEDRRLLEDASQEIPVFWSSNFSIGIFMLRRMAKYLLKESGAASIHILEEHHKSKKDSPSGTALQIFSELQSGHSNISIESARKGRTIGKHRIVFDLPEEKLIIEHQAGSRKIYAKGALRAAKWICGRPHGLFSMEDLLS